MMRRDGGSPDRYLSGVDTRIIVYDSFKTTRKEVR